MTRSLSINVKLMGIIVRGVLYQLYSVVNNIYNSHKRHNNIHILYSHIDGPCVKSGGGEPLVRPKC